MIYMIMPYCVLLLVFFFKMKRNVKLVLVFSVLTFIAACRAITVGNDTLQFSNAFFIIAQGGYSSFNWLRYESGFIFLCEILKNLSRNSQILVFTTSVFVMISFFIVVYKYSLNAIWSLFIFISFTFCASMNLMRQFMAIGFLLLMFVFFEPDFRRMKNMLFFALFVFFAAQFHNSAYFAGILFFISWNFKVASAKKMMKWYIAVALVLFCFCSVLTSFFYGKLNYLAYLDSDSFGVSNYFGGVILALNALFIALIYSKTFPKIPSEYKTPISNFLFHAVWFSFVFYALAIKVQVFSRMAVYFSAFYVLAIPYVVKWFSRCSEKKIILDAILIVYSVAFFLILIIVKPEWHGVMPYHFFFEAS